MNADNAKTCLSAFICVHPRPSLCLRSSFEAEGFDGADAGGAAQAVYGVTDFGSHARLLRSSRGVRFAAICARRCAGGGSRRSSCRQGKGKRRRARKRDMVVRLLGRCILQTIYLTMRTSKRPDILDRKSVVEGKSV